MSLCDYCAKVGANYNGGYEMFCNAKCMQNFKKYIELDQIHMMNSRFTYVPYIPPEKSEIQIPYWYTAKPIEVQEKDAKCCHCNAIGNIIRYRQLRCCYDSTDFCKGKKCKDEYLSKIIASRARCCFYNDFKWSDSDEYIIKTMKKAGWRFYMLNYE
jgi:hypothetical protein